MKSDSPTSMPAEMLSSYSGTDTLLDLVPVHGGKRHDLPMPYDNANHSMLSSFLLDTTLTDSIVRSSCLGGAVKLTAPACSVVMEKLAYCSSVAQW